MYSLELIVREFRVLRDLRIPLNNRTILYGPNNGGKTSIFHAVLTALYGEISGHEYILSGLDDADYRIAFMRDSGELFSIGVEAGDYILDYSGKTTRGGYESISNILSELVKDYGIRRTAYMRGDTLLIVDWHSINEYSIWDSDNWKRLIDTYFIDNYFPEIYEFFSNHELYIDYIYDGKFRIPFENTTSWIDPVCLPYGYRRAFLMIYAALGSDIVFIDGFENSLHIDLVLDLLKFFMEKARSKIIAIETHSGLVLRRGIEKGWTTHYINREHSRTNLDLKDLLEIKLFKKETEAFMLK